MTTMPPLGLPNHLRGVLSCNEGFHARLLDAVQEAVIATDLTGRVLFWNSFAEQLYGWNAHEIVGRSVLDAETTADPQHEAAKLLGLLQAGEAWSGELILPRRDGSTFPAQVSNSPIHDERGKVVGIVGISYDITPRKEAEKQQQHLIRELHHRVKNALATVQAILGSTARNAVSIDEFRRAFTGRVMALAQTNSILTDDASQAADRCRRARPVCS